MKKPKISELIEGPNSSLRKTFDEAVGGEPTEQFLYSTFIKHALRAGFTDDQVNFLWYWFEFLLDEIKANK